jgi:hypothetical protein
MEAQYALQKKKPLVPLMLIKGYEADGWLGLLLGTSMWYALYGEALSSESAFEGRIDALCRELGSRGRADAVVAASVTTVAEPSDLVAELSDLRLKELRTRAKAENIATGLLEGAVDSDDPKGAVLELLLQHFASQEAAADANDPSALRVELSALRLKELRVRAKHTAGLSAVALDDAADNDDPKAAVIDLLVAAAAAQAKK